jgi:DMSO/TMAO reductase YedYZ molybdopterin-dependent catalytic subunit
MTPRGTDWSHALLVSLLFASGLGTWFSGDQDAAWVFAAHAIAAGALTFLLAWKLRRVWRRLALPEQWDRRTLAGALALTLVVATLLTGWIWVTAGLNYFAGYTVLVWHAALGGVLTAAVVTHLALRAKRPRRRDLTDRRQFLQAVGIAAAGVVIWRVQRPLVALLDLPGADRRFTGSYEADSFEGNEFPTTSWVADSPRELASDSWRLTVDGEIDRSLQLSFAEVDGDDELVATLDCTGGFYSTQRWRGIQLRRLFERASARPGAAHVQVISHTGYRWSFDRGDAEGFLLATRVGGEPLSHGHGAPARLVAPGRRGFQWVKWVMRIELSDEPDYAAPASTIWSSFTGAGRGTS